MKQLQLLSLALLGAVGAGALPADAWAQALPAGQVEDGSVSKKPPFYGLGLDLNAWNQTGLWGGGGAYRNDFGFLLIPSWSIGRSAIGKGPFRTLSLSARFLFNVPVAGFDDSNFGPDAPPAAEQQPCALSQSGSLRYTDLPRCDWGRASRRVDYSDLTLILSNPRIYTIPKVDVHIDPVLLLTLPTSAQSRLATMVMQVAAQLGVGREFWKNRIGLAYTFGYGMPFFRYATGGVTYDSRGGNVPYSQDVLSRGLSNFLSDPSGASQLCEPGERCRNPTLFTQHTVRGTVNILEPLSLTVIYRITSNYFRNPGDCAEVVAFDYGPPTPVCGEMAAVPTPRSYWTDSQLFWAALNYQPLPWLGVSLSYITAAPFWTYDQSSPTDPASAAVGGGESTRHYRQGLYSVDANAFTSVSLGVDVTLETLASKFLK